MTSNPDHEDELARRTFRYIHEGMRGTATDHVACLGVEAPAVLVEQVTASGPVEDLCSGRGGVAGQSQAALSSP
jgi:hypothetical protein